MSTPCLNYLYDTPIDMFSNVKIAQKKPFLATFYTKAKLSCNVVNSPQGKKKIEKILRNPGRAAPFFASLPGQIPGQSFTFDLATYPATQFRARRPRLPNRKIASAGNWSHWQPMRSKKKPLRIAPKGFSPSEVGTRSSTIVRPHIASVEQRISRRQSFDYLPIIHADLRDGATDESERF